MNNVNNSVISDAKILINNVLSASKDPFENGLKRTGQRLMGFFAGLFTIGWGGGLFLFDAAVDDQKLNKIKAKLLDLRSTTPDQNSSDYEQAVVAREYQDLVYSHIARYTETARTIKNLAGVGSIIVTIGGIFLYADMFSDPQRFLNPNRLDFGPLTMTAMGLGGIGSMIVMPATMAKLIHTLSAGSSLEETKQDLTQKTLKQLAALESGKARQELIQEAFKQMTALESAKQVPIPQPLAAPAA